MVKKKLMLLCLALMSIMLMAGCSDYSSIQTELDTLTIQNVLPRVEGERAQSLADVEEDVYEQQMALCEMLTDTYTKTYFQNFTENNKGSDKRISEMCNNKRNEINADIRELFYKNIYELISEVEDCANPDAFVDRAYENVLTFYDAYDKYMHGDNKDVNLTNILLNYNERRNVLAHMFLAKHEKEVFKASLAVIEGNAAADDEFRFYVNKNNLIINALNDEYGGVPKEYADRITAASSKLALNLINSLSSLSDRERKELIANLQLETPTPSPTVKPTPTASAEPSATPAAAPTPVPARTAEPAPAPVRTAAPARTPVPQQQTAADDDEEEEELPSYSFD